MAPYDQDQDTWANEAPYHLANPVSWDQAK